MGLKNKIRSLWSLGQPRIKGGYSQEDEEVLASVISHMAQTGEGTDACLWHGCLPLPVNFHSPVPDLADLEQRRVWNRGVALKVSTSEQTPNTNCFRI
jgi:hypothetical protein